MDLPMGGGVTIPCLGRFLWSIKFHQIYPVVCTLKVLRVERQLLVVIAVIAAGASNIIVIAAYTVTVGGGASSTVR